METVSGEVQRGVGRGSVLGYPTINIPLQDNDLSGVYSALVYLDEDQPHIAAAFVDTDRAIVEAHLLDFEDDLYGKEVTIELHDKIRDSHKFESDDELIESIGADIVKVREYFIG